MSFWNFSNAADGEDVELRISGDIVDDEDVWIYEWLGLEAATPNAFKNELTRYAGKNIKVWIDSYGGSVFAAAGMYNALMEHKKCGANVTTIVDTKAMSAATIPLMAGNVRQVSPVGIVMVHNPLTTASGYATDLRRVADVLDEVKECIMNAYQLGTNLSRNKLSQLMDKETYMNARTAIKEGFATEMLYADPPAAGQTQNAVMDFCRLDIQNAANVSMRRFAEIVAGMDRTSPNNNKGEENNMTLEELQKNHPELMKQFANTAGATAVAAERARLTALDVLDDPNNPAVHAIVANAKESGKTADDVKFYVENAKQHAAAPPENPSDKPGQDFIANMIADNMSSGAEGVKGGGAKGGGELQVKDAAQKFMADIINKKNGRVK